MENTTDIKTHISISDEQEQRYNQSQQNFFFSDLRKPDVVKLKEKTLMN